MILEVHWRTFPSFAGEGKRWKSEKSKTRRIWYNLQNDKIRSFSPTVFQLTSKLFEKNEYKQKEVGIGPFLKSLHWMVLGLFLPLFLPLCHLSFYLRISLSVSAGRILHKVYYWSHIFWIRFHLFLHFAANLVNPLNESSEK